MIKYIILILFLCLSGCLRSQNCDTCYKNIEKKVADVLYYIDTLDKSTAILDEDCYILGLIDSAYLDDNILKSPLPYQCDIGVRAFNDFYCQGVVFKHKYQRKDIYDYLRDNYLREKECQLEIKKSIAKNKKYGDGYLSFKTYFFKKDYLYKDKLYSGLLIVELENPMDSKEKSKYKFEYQCLIPVGGNCPLAQGIH